jgi:hypothetical protein
MSTPGGFEIEVPDRNELIIKVPGIQGPAGNTNVFVQPTDPIMTEPGLWIQTGLGTDGTGITLWVEDGA